MRRLHFIVNPSAGGGRAMARMTPVVAALRDRGVQPRITVSPGIGAADELVRQCVQRGEVVVAVGGDGMVGSLAEPVVRRGGTFAIVPVGRGNDFARQLGVPTDHRAVARLLLTAIPQPVDAIEVGRRIVLGSVYAGVDSRTSQIVGSLRRMPTALHYPYGAVRALSTFPRTNYRVTVDDRVYRYLGFSVVVANSGFYGRGMHIAPDAVVDDGLLDVVLIGAGSRARFIASLPRLYRGTHVGRGEVTVVRGREVTIDAGGVPAYADGETSLPVTARILPGALSILAR